MKHLKGVYSLTGREQRSEGHVFFIKPAPRAPARLSLQPLCRSPTAGRSCARSLPAAREHRAQMAGAGGFPPAPSPKILLMLLL